MMAALFFVAGSLALSAPQQWPEGTPAPKCGPKVSRPITPTKTAAFENALARKHTVPSVLLARTFDAGNVGSVARGMLNFGLWDLRLVDPTADPQCDEAILRASGAAPLLRRASCHESMAEAAEDLQLVLATTARPRESRIPVYGPREAVTLARAAIARGERVGLLFGSEKNGLSNEELTSAHAIVTLPTFPGFSSLNLAQAVLLLCYEWASGGDDDDDVVQVEETADEAPATKRTQLDVAKAAWEAEVESADGSSARAPLKQLDSLFDWWEEVLWRCGFFGGGRAVNSKYGAEAGGEQEQLRAASAMAKIRRLLMRAQPSVGEAALLRGALQTMAVPKEGSELARARGGARGEAAAAVADVERGADDEDEDEEDLALAAEIAELDRVEEEERRKQEMAMREELAQMVLADLAEEAGNSAPSED